MKQHINGIFVMILCALVWSSTGVAQNKISIVVNKANEQKLSESDLKDFFAGAKVNWPQGEKILIADQSTTDLGAEFYKKFLDKTVNQIKMQWTKLVLSGQASAPIKCETDDAVKKAVAENKNAIGFIATAALDGSVKEILKIE